MAIILGYSAQNVFVMDMGLDGVSSELELRLNWKLKMMQLSDWVSVYSGLSDAHS